MDETIAKELSLEQQTPFHQQMLADTKALVSMSRRKMTEFYPQWDRNDDVYRSIRRKDPEDIKALERQEPDKMIVPISFAQVQTLIAFCFSLFTQRDRFFELNGFTSEDEQPAKRGEALLARDLSHSNLEALLYQFLLDIGRFGVGVIKCSWVNEKKMVRKQVEIPPFSFMGVQLKAGRIDTVTEWATSFQGNKLVNINPYRFLPDTRLPLSRFQEGEFCASEELYSVSQLKQWENEGEVAGVDFIRPLGKTVDTDRQRRWSDVTDPVETNLIGAGMKGDGQAKRPVVVTEIQRTLVPSMYLVNGEPLGEETYPVKYLVWMANDNRIIKCEPMNYLHGQFTYGVSQFIHDNNAQVNMALSDVIDQLQNVITWFINSRITNVRKIIGDKLIVNPAMVNMDDLKKRAPVIRLTAAAAGEIDRYIKQLQLQDVTTNHIGDAKFLLGEVLQMVTGINDALLGQVRPGKRSATENRNTTSGAASRLRTLACVIFRTGLEPLGRQMLSNLQDGLDEETYVKLLGMDAIDTPEFIQVTKEDLVGNYDFEVFDGTLPSDRIYTAQALEELLAMLMSNPQNAIMFQLDPRKILFEALQMRGVKNPKRFLLDQVQQQQLALQAQQLNATATQPGGAAANGTAQPTGQPTGSPTGVPGAVAQPLLPPFTTAFSNGGSPADGRGVFGQ